MTDRKVYPPPAALYLASTMGSAMSKKHSLAGKVVLIAGGAKILGALDFNGVRISTSLRQGLAAVSVEAVIRTIGLVISLVFAGHQAWAQTAAAAPATPAEPSAAVATDANSVVRALVDAMKRNDAARIRALFAPQAQQAYGDGRPKSGRAFFAWLESDIIERKGQVDEAQFTVNGSEVIVTGQFRNSRGYRAAANFRLVVDNGRIVSWQMRY